MRDTFKLFLYLKNLKLKIWRATKKAAVNWSITKIKTRPTLNPRRNGKTFSYMKTSSKHSMMTGNKIQQECNPKRWKSQSIPIERNSTSSSELQMAQEKPWHSLFRFSTQSNPACQQQKTKACIFLLIQ